MGLFNGRHKTPPHRKADCPMPDPATVPVSGATESGGKATKAVDHLINKTFEDRQPKPGEIPRLMAGLNP